MLPKTAAGEEPKYRPGAGSLHMKAALGLLSERLMAAVREKPRSTSFVDETMADLRAAYLGDSRPWILGFSGGKDSTMVAQMVYYMLASLPPEERHKHVHILASDTRVETPAIAARIRRELDSLAVAAERDRIPITTHVVYPRLTAIKAAAW